jgi:hypothetical protein
VRSAGGSRVEALRAVVDQLLDATVLQVVRAAA